MTDINNEFTDFHDMFDRVFKKTISLSSKSLIRMINSLFNEDYPINSKVTFNWTEMVDDKMRKVLADTIVTVNDSDRFHFEAQMSDDKTIIFRMLEYGFLNAKNAWEHLPDSDYTNVVMDFPKQRIIYLYHENPVPEKINVTINFEEHQVITYSVKTVDFINESIEDINSNNMIILIPFALLKLRKAFYSAQTIENTAALKSLFWNDIIGSIKKNKELGNITDTDASMLNNLSVILFEHIYSKFKESREVLSMRDQSIILEVEPYIDRMEEAEARVTEAEAEIAQLKDLVASLQSQLADKNKDNK